MIVFWLKMGWQRQPCLEGSCMALRIQVIGCDWTGSYRSCLLLHGRQISTRGSFLHWGADPVQALVGYTPEDLLPVEADACCASCMTVR